MLMYELVRPIIRANIVEDSLTKEKKCTMNLQTQSMTAKLKKAEQQAKEAMPPPLTISK